MVLFLKVFQQLTDVLGSIGWMISEVKKTGHISARPLWYYNGQEAGHNGHCGHCGQPKYLAVRYTFVCVFLITKLKFFAYRNTVDDP